MYLPKHMAAGLIQLQTTDAVEIQQKVQNGCTCCGWAGDRTLVVRAVPERKGGGWAVLCHEPPQRPYIIWLSDEDDGHRIDHRVITFLAEARKNALNMNATLDALDKHDAAVDAAKNKQQAEMNTEISKMVKDHLKKTDQLPTRHKIDRKKN